ncbi:hypothetical protein [Bradyrhizobium genosp. P]|uniref:hypothetical protein n=1 Tax=Bradyrhizobium genosp. P TaxID=83641 RepID=UPI003CF2F7FF
MTSPHDHVKPFVDVFLADVAVDPALKLELQQALLTIFGGYICEGCPHGENDLVRGALLWLDESDPGPSPEPMSKAEFIQRTGWSSP